MSTLIRNFDEFMSIAKEDNNVIFVNEDDITLGFSLTTDKALWFSGKITVEGDIDCDNIIAEDISAENIKATKNVVARKSLYARTVTADEVKGKYIYCDCLEFKNIFGSFGNHDVYNTFTLPNGNVKMIR